MSPSDASVPYPVPSAAPSGWQEALRAAMPQANIPSLLLVLRHLTGDKRWTEEPYRPKKGLPLDDNDTAGLSPELQAEVRDEALRAVIAYREGKLKPVTPTPTEVAEMLSTAMVEEIPAEYGPLLSEEMCFISRDVPIPPDTIPEGFKVLIVGAGLSGIGLGIYLAATGIDFTIIEKDDDLGGTWLENVYPGCGVDTPGHLYTFSFAGNPEASRYFALRDEVQDYLLKLAADHDLRRHIRFGTAVEEARFDTDNGLWKVTVNTGGKRETLSANVFVSAVGMVNRPFIPDMPGLKEFPGPVMHTAAWDPSVSMAGKRVGVIGTGASAMQLVPAIVDAAEHVTVFQRSKQWAIPHPNYHREVTPGAQFLMREIPFYLQWYRLRSFWNFSDRLHSSLQIDPDWPHPERSINEVNERHRVFLTKHIKESLDGRPDLIEACLPDYPPYGKRPLIDNNWYQTMRRDDVTLVTEAVDHIEGNKMVTTSGESYEVDAIALATGFNILNFLWPMEVYGRSGKTIREQWGLHDAKAFLGITVPDFPNFFILNGPNTNAGHGGSAIHACEFQVRYVMQAIRNLLASGATAVEVDRDTFLDYNTELDEALTHCIWSHSGMTTYYRNEFGRIVVTGPWKYIEYWRRTLNFDPKDYIEVPAKERELV